MAPSTDSETTGSLAPVTYLFGAEPVDVSPSPDESGEGAPQASSTERATRRAENVSLNGLTRRNMSRWEIEKLLTSRELPEDVIAAEVARLEGVGLIDDAALAETLVRTQRERKGLGRQAVIAELRRRHIDPTIIDAALDADDSDEGAEQERANELAIKKARALASYDQETAKRRLTGFLMRKGYSSSIVRAATDAALNGRASSRTGGVQFR